MRVLLVFFALGFPTSLLPSPSPRFIVVPSPVIRLIHSPLFGVPLCSLITRYVHLLYWCAFARVFPIRFFHGGCQCKNMCPVQLPTE